VSFDIDRIRRLRVDDAVAAQYGALASYFGIAFQNQAIVDRSFHALRARVGGGALLARRRLSFVEQAIELQPQRGRRRGGRRRCRLRGSSPMRGEQQGRQRQTTTM
jgi:hypothetical protein